MMISPAAWSAGMAGALIFLTIGSPLANLLASGRFIFNHFMFKFCAAISVGIASAPFAEAHFPFLQTALAWMKAKGEITYQYMLSLI